MFMRMLAAVSLVMSLSAGGFAFAQTTPVEAPAVAPKTSVSTSEFRRLALIAAFFDYESSRLAIEQAQRNSIRNYATPLVQDFRADFARLTAGLSPFTSLPTTLPPSLDAPIKPYVDDRRAQMLTQLAGATGRDFERLYVDMQAGVQEENLALFATYARSGDDAGLLAFAREKLPRIQRASQVMSRLAR
ncbi:MAG: hypothetical protein JWL93_2869 [Hyphomicrobiales bacterium]|nr:hypothetical protein [Hyphomicrobiales bacterium]